MAYCLSGGPLVEDGPTSKAASTAGGLNSPSFERWRKLDEEHRLQAVERALKAPANDLIDGYPLAL